ncbi:hypothetical protein BRARA_C01685 [Brassica rapa]|uniref:Uncharacterized protein n=1 Tax=Brassica campestris TaxID=3711 RepID=A0A397ZVK4_BRACM|nr:hypothetical protein BRARA_C01685 [Brassica rapa]
MAGDKNSNRYDIDIGFLLRLIGEPLAKLSHRLKQISLPNDIDRQMGRTLKFRWRRLARVRAARTNILDLKPKNVTNG